LPGKTRCLRFLIDGETGHPAARGPGHPARTGRRGVPQGAGGDAETYLREGKVACGGQGESIIGGFKEGKRGQRKPGGLGVAGEG